MKKIYILLIIATLITTHNYGQVYKPFCMDSTQWSVRYTQNNPFSQKTYQYKIKGDTILNGITYFKLYYSKDLIYNSPNDTLKCFLREDTTKKVYVKYPLSSGYDTTEIILYNFNLAIGDTVTLRLFNYTTDSIYKLIVSSIDDSYSTTIDSRKAYSFTYLQSAWPCTYSIYTWIEGIGSNLGGTFYNESPQNSCDDGGYNLQCFWQKGIYVLGGSFCDYWSNINENTLNNNISIYPNPTKDNLTIETNTNTAQKLEILNLIGQTVYTNSINKKAVINTSAFAKGVYILKIYSDKETIVKKFIKE